jgi:hypothetical protein
VLTLPFGLFDWIGRTKAPELGQDGLRWQMRHVRAGMLWGGTLWLLLLVPVLLPVSAVLALLLSGSRVLLILVPFVVLLSPIALMSALLWPSLQFPRSHSELHATMDGLAWKRRWPLASYRWTWRELRCVKVVGEGLSIELKSGEHWSLALPGTEMAHLHAVCEALEATRVAPPPEAQTLPELPRELRELRQRTSRQDEAT